VIESYDRPVESPKEYPLRRYESNQNDQSRQFPVLAQSPSVSFDRILAVMALRDPFDYSRWEGVE
jgi:hypothetical protein